MKLDVYNLKLDIIMSIKYGEPFLFKPQNVCKRSGRIKVLSITNKVEDSWRHWHLEVVYMD